MRQTRRLRSVSKVSQSKKKARFMIDVINQRQLTEEQRAAIARRVIYSQPYMYRIDFPIEAGVTKNTLVSQGVLGINRDFYLTELQANFDQVFQDTGSLFDVTLYSAFNRSLWRFDAGQRVPSGFVLTDARFRVPIVTQIFDDRQHENFPIFIRQNDKVFGEIRNQTVIGGTSNATIVLKGFNVSPNDPYLSAPEVEQISRSLAAPVRWEYFSLRVEDETKKEYVIENDRYPRLVLGFGAVNSTDVKTDVSEATVMIDDLSRRLRLTDKPIPLEFLAPRLTCLADSHMYFLPIEYYWQPLGRLQFTIENIFAPLVESGFQLVMYTRTI